MHFVLDDREKRLGCFGIWRVVDTRRVDVENLLEESAFGRADVSNTFEKFIEVIGLAVAWRIFESLVIHGESLYQEFAQTSRRPLPKLRATKASNEKANGKNCRQTVVFDLACNLSFSFDSNYSEIPNSCLSVQFAFVVNPFQMFIYGWNRNLKQFCHIGLCKPNSLVFKSALYACTTIFGLE